MINVTQLDNGLVVATDQMSDVRSVSIGCWVKVGSRDETPEVAGCSHFLEHMIFKGTSDLTAFDVAVKLDAIGGESNAFTSREATAFYVRLLAEKVEMGTELLFDLLSNAAFRTDDLETERQVMLEEIYHHLDEPSDLVWQKFMEGLFNGHPMGRDVQGSIETISSITRDQIIDFWDSFYRTRNMILVAAGNVNHEQFLNIVQSFEGFKLGGQSVDRVTPSLNAPTDVVVPKETEQVHILIGSQAPGATDSRRWDMQVLNKVLGGGMSSRLFQEVREKRGLVYSIGSDWAGFSDCGAFVVSASSSPSKSSEVIKVIRAELEKIQVQGITPEEFELAKSHAKAAISLSSEDSLHRMGRLGSSLALRHEAYELDEILKKIEEVELDNVNLIAQAIFSKPFVMALVGPNSEEVYNEVL